MCLMVVLFAIVTMAHVIKWASGRETGITVICWLALLGLVIAPKYVTYFRRRARRARVLLERVSRGPE